MKSERYFTENITLKKIPSPEIDTSINPVPLEDETIRIRLKKILGSIAEENLDCIIIYEDMEHGGNFEYLTGFLTRFEEALLVLHQKLLLPQIIYHFRYVQILLPKMVLQNILSAFHLLCP